MTGSTGADLVITGGTVIDPTQDLHEARDVVIADGKIAALALPGAAPSAPRVLDAHGLLVTPGLIDLHTHVYLHVGEVNIDANSLAARSGTTTMVDAGSAGAAIFDGFRHYVAARARCRLLALLNISVIGAVASPMAGYGRFVDPTATAETVEANRDLIVGVKVLGSRIRVGEDNTDQPVWHAHAAARAAGVPLMLHIGDPPPTITQSIPILDKGDLITHCYKGELVGRLVNRDGTPAAVLQEARKRGGADGRGSWGRQLPLGDCPPALRARLLARYDLDRRAYRVHQRPGLRHADHDVEVSALGYAARRGYPGQYAHASTGHRLG